MKPTRSRLYELLGMVEKPPIEKAPSEFAIMGRYVLTPDIFGLLAEGKPQRRTVEIQLTDGLLAAFAPATRRFSWVMSLRGPATTWATGWAFSLRKSVSA